MLVRRTFRTSLGLLCLIGFPSAFLFESTPRPALAQATGSPNVVVIVTDDQRFDSLRVMPHVQELMSEGMTLRRAIVTNPLCCPSRATLLTGRYSHTTGVYTNTSPFGGWTSFQASEGDTIATALDDAGYRTALVGKYLNGYSGETVYVPPGWDRWFAMLSPGRYYDYTVLDSQLGIRVFDDDPRYYSTDVFRRQAVRFVRGVPAGTPLFLVVAPFAPHSPWLVAQRHQGAFASSPVRLGPAVNEADVSDKPAYIAARPLMGERGLRSRVRRQWGSLLAVDDLVGAIMTTLDETGRTNDTLVIFTSDNGSLNGEHRWTGKQVPYEESIRVPLVMHLPGQIPAGTVSAALVSNVDLAPTIADFADVTLSADGVSLRPLLTDAASSVRDAVVLEHVDPDESVPTYCGVRTSSFTFVRLSTGEEELYDLASDPKQLVNVVATRPRKADELRALATSLCDPVPPGFSW